MSNGKRFTRGRPKQANKDAAVEQAIASGAVPVLPPQAVGPLANKPVEKRFVPFGDRVACYIEKTPDRTENGVFIAGASAGQFITPIGVVVAVGPEVKQVKPGDHVLLLATTVAQKVFYKGDAYVVFEEHKVCGVIDPEQLKPEIALG